MSDIDLKPCPYCGSDNIAVQMSRYRGEAASYYYALCGNCKMAGPEVSNEEGEGIAEEQAAEAWNALPRRLRWTTEKPTEPDFYWHRNGGVLSIAYIYEAEGALFCHFAGEEGIAPLLDLVTGEWAGPIPEPHQN